MIDEFDGIVIGSGHAGIEAAFALAHKKHTVALFTLNKEGIAQTPCNPSIGGPAKGIVTREIDALGGMQAIATDANALQIKLLNSSKGPGVWAYRAQIDKEKYHQWFVNKIKSNKYIKLILNEVNSLIVKNKKIIGIKTKDQIFYAKTIIITTGTYMNAITHVGDIKEKSGPLNFPRSSYLSQSIIENGFKVIRLKTGTPARIDLRTISINNMEIENGTDAKLHFHFYSDFYLPISKQIPCYLTYTNAKTHKIIKDNIHTSAMYSGQIKGVGPRYCPSIEDKIVRFADKPRHQIFVEPVCKDSYLGYLQGLSTSLSKEIQDKMIHSIKGLENVKIIKYGYAIEYDAIDPIQLWPTLESKIIKNLYFAGQVNGTSGYEEAAGQGIIAGINAALNIENKKQLILNRNESYIGVMIDDIVTKGIQDPYRLLTSRAEHRLYLRNDNADNRLTNIGYKIGLVNKKQYSQFLKNQEIIKEIINFLKNNSLSIIPEFTKKYHSHSLYQLLKQPQIKIDDILQHTKYKNINDEIKMKISILVKFSGYIKHEDQNLQKFDKYLNLDISMIKDYKQIKNLPLEAREKLNKIQPLTLAQASRIQGISINDLMLIKYYIETKK